MTQLRVTNTSTRGVMVDGHGVIPPGESAEVDPHPDVDALVEQGVLHTEKARAARKAGA